MIEITDHKEIATQYFKTWFFLDLISIIPLDALIRVFATSEVNVK